ncbi:MAG: hypothetical protein GX638_08665 [Crenarchaeota archaeon]|jgi:hypothetical protein|nr:hypothetical protein [Thermoproteota archaeon]
MLKKIIYKLCIVVACTTVFCNAADSLDTHSVDKDPIFANFCFYKDTSPWFPEDTVYTLTYYEMENELTFTLNYKSTNTSYNFGVRFPDLDIEKIRAKLFIAAGGSGPGLYLGRKHSESKTITPYDLIDFYVSIKDSLYVKSLFGTTNRLTWVYTLDMGKQEQEMTGDNIIYISGACTEEQMKMIRDRQKENQGKEQ